MTPDEKLLRNLLKNSVRTIPRYNGVPCLEWQRFCHKGYGRIRHDGDKRRVHVVAYKLMKGPLPVGHHVLHHCDTPACWEPTHLWDGTQAQNLADMAAKGRAVWQRRRMALVRGEVPSSPS